MDCPFCTLSSCWLVCLAITPVYAANPHRFSVTPEFLTDKPISPRLYSNFIELGYGVQVEPMCAEMIFNRSFEPFTPYKSISVEWFDLWNDPANPSLGYQDDWSGEDWYHSGYEHNAWFAAPGRGGRLPIDEKSTFFVTRTDDCAVSLEPQPGGSGHGVQHLRVENHEHGRWGGLAQEGKYLRPGAVYHFRGKFRAPVSPVRVELRFYKTGEWDAPLAVLPLGQITDRWSERTVEFANEKLEGWATIALWIPPNAEVEVDDFSLRSANHYCGWRREIIEPLRRIRPAVVRAPGGCFASFYDWRDGIGPLSQREPQPSYFWGGMNYNDVGVAELAMLCRAINAEMMWCVNVYHPLKANYEWYFGDAGPPPGRHGFDFQKFRDIEQGAKDAADLVAYCNLDSDAHAQARMRAEHGYHEPFRIKYWELDNEVHRWFAPEEYARAAVVYARAMKAVDPTICVGMVTYGERPVAESGQTLGYHQRLPAMLEIAGRDIDFLADRGPSEQGYLEEVIGWMNDYNARHGTALKYCETEKLFYEQFPDVENRVRPQGGYTKSFMFSKWYYALKAVMEYMAYQRAGGDVDFVVFNNLANTHSQCVIETPKEGVYLTAAGVAMAHLAASPAHQPLRFANYQAGFNDDFQASAAWDKTRRRLVLYVLNRTGVEREVEFEMARLDRPFRRRQSTTLSAAEPFAMNTLQNPDAIRRSESPWSKLDRPDGLQLVIPPWSFTETIVE